MENPIKMLRQYEDAVQERLRALDREKFGERLWAKDPALWKSDPESKKKIRNRLGWLTIVQEMSAHAEDLAAFARSIKEEGFTDAVLLGMGGSSLCPEVFRKTYGVAPGYPDLRVLDSTDPATILNVECSVNLQKTLFILASKSGTTIEMESLYRYFSGRLQAVVGGSIGTRFIAITDPETPLEALAREQRFRRIFTTPADIGGRYSALTYFGLVPLALIGADLSPFLDRSLEMVRACGPSVPAGENAGVSLGAILAEIGMKGRDKVTFLASPAIGSFGYWVEQLLAESTGKEGKGLLPIEGEPLGEPEVYGEDRLFVELEVSSSGDETADQRLLALQTGDHPIVRIPLRGPLDLAGEFFRWEVATATAGAILGVNPFDEPNVTESKENTKRLLEEFKKSGQLPPREPVLEEGGIRLFTGAEVGSRDSIWESFKKFLERSKASDYVALMAYVERSEANESLLQEFRARIRDRTRLATTLGFGPRFLHSTGQFHKGGPDSGIFIQITAEDATEVPIPGEPYGFSLLKRAQALGDFLALSNRGRRVIEVRVGREVERDLRRLLGLIQ
jgi:transaldolase/glucose-6-phosphate isomerase